MIVSSSERDDQEYEQQPEKDRIPLQYRFEVQSPDRGRCPGKDHLVPRDEHHQKENCGDAQQYVPKDLIVLIFPA